MEAPAKLQQEGEEYDLKVEEVVGLLSWQSTTRIYGVHEGGVSGNGDSSTDSSRTSKNGTHAEEEPEAGQEWVEEVNGGENDVEAKGPETEAEQEPGEEREAAPERDEVDENGSNGGANGKGDVAVLAPAAKTEPHSHNGVKMNESTWTNIVHFDDGRGIESIQTIVKTEYSDVERVSYETETVDVTSNVATRRFSAFQSSLVDHQERGISGYERSPRKSNEEKNTYSKESEVVEEVNLIEKPNAEETEFDVERVLEKQNTHDLYCPNCKSHITRTVILERKERKLPVHDAASKPAAQPEPVQTPSIRDHPTDGDQRAFKCQTCFGIFILKGVWPFIEIEDAKEESDPSEEHDSEGNFRTADDAGIQTSDLLRKEPMPNHYTATTGKPRAGGIGQVPPPTTPPNAGEEINDAVIYGTGQVPPPTTPPNAGEEINDAVIYVPPGTETQTPPEQQPVAQVPQPREWDILKSIVYGGLIESITSLAVVSSAAGAGAATLNTLGLGLANLFGGLITIAHNLRELKSTEQVDRYQEALGKEEHFTRHAVVAILSFIIFGCVAPITYAFSFRESDNRDYKLAAVAAASLLCIFLLAIGKAYVRKPPKAYFETVLHYVIMGFMASGISFLVGELIDELLTKLGWFNSTSSLSGTGALETGTTQSGWASY